MITTIQKHVTGPTSPPTIFEEEKGVEISTSTSSTGTSTSDSPTNASLPLCVEATMPPGVAIRPNAFGLGLFATRSFQAGETLYITSCIYVPDIAAGKVTLRLTGSGEEYILDMQEHSVVQSDLPGKRQLYTYDAFMNHGCDPNTSSFVTACTNKELTYGMKALRGIATGEELTCDYNLFEFDAGDAAISLCQCGASGCLGAIKGFRYLRFEQALPRFAMAEPYVIASYLAEHPEVYFLDLRSQHSRGYEAEGGVSKGGEDEVGIEVTFDEEGGCKAVATKAWASGEVLLRDIQLPQAPQQHLQQEGEQQCLEVRKSQAFVVVLAPGVAQGSASVDLTGFGIGGKDREERKKGGEEMKETWPIRLLFGGGARRKGEEGGANIRVEREGGREGERETYRVVVTAAIAMGQAVVVGMEEK
ncbi:nuclear protein set [Nannochloropsis oceanica]